MIRQLVLVVAAVLLFGCTEGLRGVRMTPPALTGKPAARVTTSGPGGLRVLWNGRASGREMKWNAWIASDPEELEAVWDAAGGRGSAPRVDFQNYVVLAVAGEGGLCPPRILGLDAESSGLLTLRYEDLRIVTCMDLAVRTAKIIAVPRRVLTATVVFFDGFAFQVPPLPFGA